MIKDKLETLLDIVPISAIQNWLKLNNKPHTATNKKDFIKKILKWIDKGEVSIRDIELAILDIEENGGKKIKLKTIENFDLKKFTANLNNKGITISKTDNISLRDNRISKLNYVFIDETAGIVKIKWSEKQEDLGIDYQTRQVNAIEKTIFIIVVIEIETGFTQIRYDTPQDIHTYLNDKGVKKDSLYELHYLNALYNLLPTSCTLKDYSLKEVARHLLMNEKDKFIIKNESLKVSKNGVQRYSVTNGDIRDLPARIGAEQEDGDHWVVNNITGEWKSVKSNGSLTRNLFMRMSRDESTINFQRDCVSNELNYAINEIRSIKKLVN